MSPCPSVQGSLALRRGGGSRARQPADDPFRVRVGGGELTTTQTTTPAYTAAKERMFRCTHMTHAQRTVNDKKRGWLESMRWAFISF